MLRCDAQVHPNANEYSFYILFKIMHVAQRIIFLILPTSFNLQRKKGKGNNSAQKIEKPFLVSHARTGMSKGFKAVHKKIKK